jgi:hypothetical protein
MSLTFYPHEDDLVSGAMLQKIEVLMEAAERYKAVVLDAAQSPPVDAAAKKRIAPVDLKSSYNWEEVSKLLREIRDLSEATPTNKLTKAEHLTKLAEIYEALRSAKMPKLEGVRLALVNEAAQLRSSASQVA